MDCLVLMDTQSSDLKIAEKKQMKHNRYISRKAPPKAFLPVEPPDFLVPRMITAIRLYFQELFGKSNADV